MKVLGADPFVSLGNELSWIDVTCMTNNLKIKVAANSDKEWWGWRKDLWPQQWDPEVCVGPRSKLLCKTHTELKRSQLLPFSYYVVSWVHCCRRTKSLDFVCDRSSFAMVIRKILNFCVTISFKCEQVFLIFFLVSKRTVYMKSSSITGISGSLILKLTGKATAK